MLATFSNFLWKKMHVSFRQIRVSVSGCQKAPWQILWRVWFKFSLRHNAWWHQINLVGLWTVSRLVLLKRIPAETAQCMLGSHGALRALFLVCQHLNFYILLNISLFSFIVSKGSGTNNVRSSSSQLFYSLLFTDETVLPHVRDSY